MKNDKALGTRVRSALLMGAAGAMLLGGAAQGSQLSDAAAALQPGQWAQINTTGFNSSLLVTGDRYILEYAESMRWDPQRQEMHFVGAGHYEPARHIVYREATNSWTQRSLSGFPLPMHGYDHLALDPTGRKLFHRYYNEGGMGRYDLDAQSWSDTAAANASVQVAGGIDWFPEVGKVIFFDSGGIYGYSPPSNSWSTLAGAPAGAGPYHNFAEYSLARHVLIMGGGNGSRAVYKMVSSGTITRMRDAPVDLAITDSIVTSDPISGNFLIFTGGTSYEYDPVADTWSALPKPPFVSAGYESGVFGAVAGPISTHGVVMVAKFDYDSSRVWLYRHRAGSGVPTPPTPTINLSANPTTVNAQGSTALTWSTSNADSCSASPAPLWSGSKATSGNETVGPITAATTFQLSCTNTAGGSASKSVNVSVASSTPAPTVTLSANPTTVPMNGSSTLSWTTSSATSCTGSGGWSGSKSVPNGSQSVGPLSASTTYTLACTGAGGTTQKSVTVNLTGAPVVNISANPTTVSAGGTSQLTWSSQNATGCTASGAWSGNKAPSGTAQTPTLNTTGDFVLTCTGAGGSGQASARVTVSGTSPAAPTVTLSANPTTVAMNGSSTLSWTTSNATSCTGSGGWSGSKSVPNGSQSVGPLSASTTYTLACTGAGGTTQKSVTVNLAGAPVVNISANPTTVSAGGASQLTWSSQNATACSASGAWSGNKATSGNEQTPVLNTTSDFVLTCTGAGGSAQSSAQVTVSQPSPSAPTVNLSVSAASVAPNATVTLNWTSTNADTCMATGGWSGTKASSGSETSAALNTTTTFTLECSGAGGSASDSELVTVVAGAGDGGGSTTSTDSGGGALDAVELLLLSLILSLGRIGYALRFRTSSVLAALLMAGGIASPSQAADFATRCADPKVVRCYGFEDSNDIANRTFGRSGDGKKLMSIDTTTKASGNSSLKFEIPPLSSADTSGSFFLNFADDFSQRFGEGSEFYVQWRQRFSPEMLRAFRGANGWKQIIIGAGDYPGTISYSCSEQETVMQQDPRLPAGGFPMVYHSCGRFESLDFYDGTQVRMQHQGPPYCYYPDDPSHGCKLYVANQWVTFQMHIKVVKWNEKNSVFHAWMASEGQPSVMIFNSDLVGGMTYYRNNDPNAFFGKVWLLPYNTNKDDTESYPTAYTWYDDLIISRARIPDPDATTPAPTPTINLSANPTTVNAQGSTALTWSTSNADSCSASPAPLWSGSKATSGNETVGPITAATTFQLSCTNTAGGSASKSVNVSVASSTPAPTVTLSANPTTVPMNGSSTLSWTTSSATSCTGSGGWSGSKSVPNGSQSVGPLSASTTYTLACTGAGGTTQKSVTVNLTGAPVVNISANPTTVSAGGTSQLTWSSQNATGCTASGAWSGNKAPSGTAQTPTLNTTGDFVLTCTGAGGSGQASARVTVSGTSPAAPTVTLSANPTTVAMNGSSTLSWTTSNATSCTGSGGWSGSKSVPNGSQSVGPLSASTTYTLACTGAGGTTQKSVTVNLAGAPVVNISANPTTVSAGGASQLTWSSQNATACSASGAWSGNKATSGNEQTPVLNTTSDFVLTCTGAGGSAQSSAQVTVSQPSPSAPTVNLSVSAASVAPNATVTLNWTSTNADTCMATGGWSGTKASSGSETSAALNTTTTFTLECSGAGGSASDSELVTVVAGAGDGGGSTTSTDSGGGALDWLALALLGLLIPRQRR